MQSKVIVVGVLVAFAASSYAADTEYVETECSVKPNGILWLQLQTPSNAKRSISFDPGIGGTIAFKGTTLNDGKWISHYKNSKEAILRSPAKTSVTGMLELVSSNGSTKKLGWVSSACWQQLQGATSGALATRVLNGV